MNTTSTPLACFRSRTATFATALVSACVLSTTLACQPSETRPSEPPTSADAKAKTPPPPGALPVSETGEISFYADSLAGNLTANGETYAISDATCAHRTLKFGTWLHVTDVATKKTATCRVNDRGPYAKGRVLDVSRAVAKTLDFESKGHIRAELRVLPGPPSPP